MNEHEKLASHLDNELMRRESEARQEMTERKEPELTAPGRPRQSETYSNPVIPGYAQDPVGHLHGVARHLHQENQSLRNEAALANHGHAVRHQVAEFMKTHPDYSDALEHLAQSEAEMHRMSGVP